MRASLFVLLALHLCGPVASQTRPVPLDRLIRADGIVDASRAAVAGPLDLTGYDLSMAPDGLRAVPQSAAAGEGARSMVEGEWGLFGGAIHAGANATIEAVAAGLTGDLYVTGQFSSIDGVSATRVARWNGTTWSALGTGLAGGNFPAGYAIAVAPDGTVYVGGSFTTAGGVAANNIARFVPGTGVWSALGSGTDASVRNLAVAPDGTVYAAGTFTTAGGASAPYLASWNGATWSALGTGPSDYVESVSVGADGTLYAGGRFLTAGGVTVNRIASWNGSAWSAMGTGVSGVSNKINDVFAAPDGSVYVAGIFQTIGGTHAELVAAWNGTSWSALGANNLGNGGGGAANALKISMTSSGQVVVAGSLGFGTNNSSVAVLNGSVWTRYGNAVEDGFPSAFALSSTGQFFAVGWFERLGGFTLNTIARYDPVSEWQPVGANTFNNPVHAAVLAPDGSIFVGGSFTVTPSGPARRIARWNGSVWSPLGSGMDGDVEALAVASDGTLYAGGRFEAAGGVAAEGVAAWNGSAWSGFGSGLSVSQAGTGVVSALAISTDGALYAGGNFSVVSAPSVRDLARWDGSQWQSVGGNPFGTVGAVLTLLAEPGGALVAAGTFTSIGGVNGRVGRWNGTGWSTVGSLATAAPIRSLARAPDGSLLVGADDGLFRNLDGVWTLLGTPSAIGGVRQINSLFVLDSGMVYAGGRWGTLAGAGTNVARYHLPTGTWQSVNGPANTVRALSPTQSGDVIALGDFTQVGSFPRTAVRFAALYDAPPPPYSVTLPSSEGWAQLTTGVGNNVFAVAVGPDGAIYAGGSFTTAGGAPANRIARWDGTAWSPLGVGVNNAVQAIAVAPDGTLYASGSFTTAGGASALRIARWNGAAWSPLGTGLGAAAVALALAPDGTLYAGGGFGTAGGAPAAGIAAWNGASWSALGSGISGDVYAIAVGEDGVVYAGGEYATAGGAPSTNLAAWNGSSWTDMGSGFNSPVYDLAVGGDGVLYVGGDFLSADGAPASYVATWNGTTWGTLGTGLNGPVEAILVDPRGDIYVGGSFTTAGGAPANRVARWDGSAWSALGSGTNNTVRSLAFDRVSGIVAGGAFTNAGGGGANRIARWQTPFSIALGGGEGWRMLSVPANGVRLMDYLEPIWTQAIPGSDAPAADPDLYCNVFVHDETVRTDRNNDGVISSADGWDCAATLDAFLPPGRGLLVYVFADDNNDGTPDPFPKTLSIPGGPFATLVDLPFQVPALSFTDSPVLPDLQEGFNYVGNPTPLALDSDLFLTSDLAATSYVWDPTLFGGDYRTWNGAAGELTNGILPPGQGFFVQGSGAAPALSIPIEATRTGGLPTYARAASPVLRFELARRDGATHRPEASAFVHLDAGAASGVDRLDGLRLTPMRWPYATLYTVAPGDPGGTALVVSALPSPIQAAEIPLGVATAGLSGNQDVRLSWDGFASFPDGWDATLVDLANGTELDLLQPGQIDFSHTGSAAPQERPATLAARPAPLAVHGDDLIRGQRFVIRLAPRSVTSDPGTAPEWGLSAPFPNPARNHASLSFALSAPGSASLTIYDALGRQVATAAKGDFEAGRHTVTLDTRSLASGVYSVRLDAGDGRVDTRRLSVAR